MKMTFSKHYDADVETVFGLMSDPDTVQTKYAECGSADVSIDSHDDRNGNPWNVITRKITVDLPGFAKKVMQPTNTVTQTDDWKAVDGSGQRVCKYAVEVKGVPSRIDGTITLRPDAGGTTQDVVAEVKVSIPLLGGRLEKFAVESGLAQLAGEAAWIETHLSDLPA